MDTLQLERECQSYTRYLIGQPATPYVIEKYKEFHQGMDFAAADSRFDGLLLSASARGPLWARLVDSYATRWRKNSIVRRKLVVALALLECVNPSFAVLDECPRGGPAAAVVRLGLGALGYACSVLAAAVLFSPVRLWLAFRER